MECRLQDDAYAGLDHVFFRILRALAPFRPVRHAAFFRARNATGADRRRFAQHPAPEIINVLRVVFRTLHLTLFAPFNHNIQLASRQCPKNQ